MLSSNTNTPTRHSQGPNAGPPLKLGSWQKTETLLGLLNRRKKKHWPKPRKDRACWEARKHMEKQERTKSSLCSWSQTEISAEGLQWELKQHRSNALKTGPCSINGTKAQYMLLFRERESKGQGQPQAREWGSKELVSHWQYMVSVTHQGELTEQQRKRSKGRAWHFSYKTGGAGISGHGSPWVPPQPWSFEGSVLWRFFW